MIQPDYLMDQAGSEQIPSVATAEPAVPDDGMSQLIQGLIGAQAVRTVMSPAVRLQIKMAEASKKKNDERRLVDEKVMPIIEADIQASEERERMLSSRMDNVFSGMRQAPPEMMAPEMSDNEIIAGALASAFAPGQAGEIYGVADRRATQRAQVSNQNAMNTYEAGQQALGREGQFIAGALDDERQTSRTLRTSRTNYLVNEEIRKAREAADLGKQNEAEGRAVRAAFFGANTLSEAKVAARILKENYPKFAPTREELAELTREFGEKVKNEFAKQVTAKTEKFDLSEADRKNLNAEREAIIAEFGLDPARVPEIPTGDALAKMKLDETNRHNKAQEQLAKDNLNLAKDRFKWVKDVQHRDQNAQRWAAIRTAQGHLAEAQRRGDFAAQTLYLKMFDDESSELYLEAEKKSRELVIKLNGLNSAIVTMAKSAKTKAEKNAVKEKQSKLQELQGEYEGWQEVMREEAASRAGEGLGPSEKMKASQEFAAGSRSSGNPERDAAVRAIQGGAPIDQVRARYKQRTGLDLDF